LRVLIDRNRIFFLWRGGVSLLLFLWVTGCAQVLPLAAIAPTAVHFGSVAYQSVERAQIDVVVSPGIAQEDLGAITHVAIVMGGESRTRPYGRIGDLASVVGDNLSVELARLGFQVHNWNRTGEDAHKVAIQTLAEEGKTRGAQAVVTGNVAAGHTRSLGMFGVGGFKTVVQSATLRVIDVKTSTLLLMITINYRVGQSPKVAAEGMAMVLQAKLEDPSGDLREQLREKMREKT